MKTFDPGDVVWTTRDKREVKLKDMGTSHLRNAARMLRRYADDHELTVCCAVASVQGDMASYYAEHALDEAMEDAAHIRWAASQMEAVIASREGRP